MLCVCVLVCVKKVSVPSLDVLERSPSKQRENIHLTSRTANRFAIYNGCQVMPDLKELRRPKVNSCRILHTAVPRLPQLLPRERVKPLIYKALISQTMVDCQTD